MSTLKRAVLRQIVFAHYVREFLRDIIRRLVPGSWSNSFVSSSNTDFDLRLESALKEVDEATATKSDYCRTVVSVLCDEISRICDLVQAACEAHGYAVYATRFLSKERFIAMLLRTDVVLMGKLRKVLEDPGKGHVQMLREIGAILDGGDPQNLDALDGVEGRMADYRLGRLLIEVKNGLDCTNRKLLDYHQDTIAVVRETSSDAVARLEKKIGEKLFRTGTRRSKFSDEMKRLCVSCWREGKKSADIRCSLNTRVTYEAVYSRNKSMLAEQGVKNVAMFRSILRACQLRESRRRDKEKN